jgi:hypothetical protein
MGAHFYSVTICDNVWRKTVWPGEPIEREKGGGGRVGSWKSQFANIVHSRAHHPPSQPTIAAHLLGEPAAGEPYTILIMHSSSVE